MIPIFRILHIHMLGRLCWIRHDILDHCEKKLFSWIFKQVLEMVKVCLIEAFNGS